MTSGLKLVEIMSVNTLLKTRKNLIC